MTKEEIRKILQLSLEYYKLEIFGTGKESEPPTEARIDWIYERMKLSSPSNLDEEENMNKVVYNNCCGGFGLSEEAQNWMHEHGHPEYAKRYPKIERHNPLLVQCVEELGDCVNTEYSELRVEAIKGNKYWIEHYDGLETVHTPEEMKWVVIE